MSTDQGNESGAVVGLHANPVISLVHLYIYFYIYGGR